MHLRSEKQHLLAETEIINLQTVGTRRLKSFFFFASAVDLTALYH